MLVKLLMYHDTQGYQSIVKRMDKRRYQRLLERIGEKDGQVELLKIEILEE